MGAKERILKRLRNVQSPFPEAHSQLEHHLPVVPLEDGPQTALKRRFIQEAQELSCNVYAVNDDEDVAQIVLEIIHTDQQVSAWGWDQIPFVGLEGKLAGEGVEVTPPEDPNVRVGITGAAAALAATGSLVLDWREKRPSSPSLLPPVHIAIIRGDQILPNFESWIARQRLDDLKGFHRSGKFVIISGPSRTADIGMELILGMHGPGELHIIILPTPL